MNETPSTNPTINDCDPRVQLAAERTLLAWIRTGLSLMAFGFVVTRFALILQTIGVKTDSVFSFSATLIGIFMVLLGVVANGGASLHYRSYFFNLRRNGKTTFTAWSLAIWVAFASAIIGFFLIVYLLLVDVASWETGLSSIKEVSTRLDEIK